MGQPVLHTSRQRSAFLARDSNLGVPIQRAGRGVALIGLVLPLLLIGGLKFTQVEIDALRPMIGGTPWLAWLVPVFGAAGASYLIGGVEILTAILLVVSPWAARAGVVGGALAALTFLTTCSMLVALPAWDENLGGFPALAPLGQFLIKDVALLGVALVVSGEGLSRMRARSRRSVEQPDA